MLLTPIKKENKYVSIPSFLIEKVITDVKIKSIRKLIDGKGYCIVLYISKETNNDIIKELNDLDNDIIKIIEDNSLLWFDKTFSDEEIYELYNRSFCNQTKTINVILTNKQYNTIMYNNKPLDTVDKIIDILKENNHYKKCLINITIEYRGIYFYSETTSNKWVIKNLDVTDINLDNNNIDSINKDDILEKLCDNIFNMKNKLINRNNFLNKYIMDLKDQENIIDKLFIELKTSQNKKLQNLLNKMNESLIYQEDKIKRSI